MLNVSRTQITFQRLANTGVKRSHTHAHTRAHTQAQGSGSHGSVTSLAPSSPGAPGSDSGPVVDPSQTGLLVVTACSLGALGLPRAWTRWWGRWESMGVESSQFPPEGRAGRGSRHALHSGPRRGPALKPSRRAPVRRSGSPTFPAPPPGGFPTSGKGAAFPDPRDSVALGEPAWCGPPSVT